jgi:predicted membrane-bound spermidine synthase
MTIANRGWFLAIFAASGFAGLIYESLWSHYLKLFLGHAAYAQTLVLATFMGGMAFGAWACSLYAGRSRNLLVLYAVAEAAIGIIALVFHTVFVAATDLAYDAVIPALGSPFAVAAFKWLLCAALILPQSILLGTTFPLMSAGVMRRFPERPGQTIAMLYFTNSLGAALGVLASGFYLIGAVGLPGTALTAGLLNIALALVVWLLAKDAPSTAIVAPPLSAGRRSAHPGGYWLMLVVALLTGAASFMYEIGWIRMLSMVLGGSTHAFELMLSAFILGLALGGFWIRRHVDRYAVPERALGVIQVAMGLLALATLPFYSETFELMQALMDAVARTERGYAAFNAGSHLIALAVMLPATFCAGMTLPLITHALMKKGGGERVIGMVYAANTVGAIAGVMVAMHLAMPYLGLKGLITLGSVVDIGLGLALLWRFAGRAKLVLAGAAGAACVAGTLAWVELDSLKMASGVYRSGKLIRQGEAEVLFHRDGKSATVNLVQAGSRLSIVTNGKSDAMVNLAPDAEASDDEPVMIMTGALPALLYPSARRAAVIGIGSGISGHVLLGSEALRELDTIEIEPAMVEAARSFRSRNSAVFDDPRSRIYIEDAKTFFSLHGKRYDLIVSEPSNPWVSGIASLFSEEFYRRLGRHLEPGGLFVQWLQVYEMEPALVASVVKALARNFASYELYATDEANLIIVARNAGPVPRVSEEAFRQPRLAASLERLQVRRAADLELFRIGPREAVQPYFSRFAIAPNSDYFPILDQNAARARFMGARASEVIQLGRMPIPAIDFLGGARREVGAAMPRAWLKRSESTYVSQQLLAYLSGGDEQRLHQLPLAMRSDAQLTRMALTCPAHGVRLSVDQLVSVANALLPYLAAQQSRDLWRMLRGCHPGAPQAGWLDLFAAVDARDARQMARDAQALLDDSDYGSESHADYLLAAAIVGHLARDERTQAQQLWRRYSSRVSSDRDNVLPEFLSGHLFAATEN